MNTAIRKLPQGLGAGFAENMPAQSSKHLELMRLLDSQVDEHLAWSSDEPPPPPPPPAPLPKAETVDPDPPALPVPGAEPNPGPSEWADTVLDPSSAIDVAFTESKAANDKAPVPGPSARLAWPLMKSNLPWLMFFFASIPLTVWLTLQWSDSAPMARTAVAEQPQAKPAAQPARTPVAAALPPAPAQAVASPVPMVAAAQSSQAAAPAGERLVHDGGVVAEAVTTPPQAPLQPTMPPAAAPSRPIDSPACAESRAALGLCSTQHGPSTTSPGVKP